MFTAGGRDLRGQALPVDGAFNNPQPIRGDIPILIGGSGERKTLRFVAKYADGSNFFGDVERVKHLLGVLEGHCERRRPRPGRDHQDPHGHASTSRARTRRRTRRSRPRSPRARRPRPRAGAGLRRATRTRSPSRSRRYLDAGLDGVTISMPDVLRPRERGAGRRDARGGDRDPHRVTPEEVRRIAAIRNPVLRNLEITYAYSLLAGGDRAARAARARTGARSRPGPRARPGRTIRGEDAIGYLQDRLGATATCCTRSRRSGAGCCGAGCSTAARGSGG